MRSPVLELMLPRMLQLGENADWSGVRYSVMPAISVSASKKTALWGRAIHLRHAGVLRLGLNWRRCIPAGYGRRH